MRTRATFVLDDDLLKKLKKTAIDESKSYSECLEELIKMKVDGLIKNSKAKKK